MEANDRRNSGSFAFAARNLHFTQKDGFATKGKPAEDKIIIESEFFVRHLLKLQAFL